jgi:hypothetical protein
MNMIGDELRTIWKCCSWLIFKALSQHLYGGTEEYTFFFPLVLQPLWALVSAFQFHDHFTDGRTPWTSDQLVAKPLTKHRTTQTQNKHTPNIHALCGIRTHDPSFRASEDSSYLRLLGYCDRHWGILQDNFHQNSPSAGRMSNLWPSESEACPVHNFISIRIQVTNLAVIHSARKFARLHDEYRKENVLRQEVTYYILRSIS